MEMRSQDERERVQGQNCNKFMMLMWKNWKLQSRRPIKSIVEILTPVLFAVLMLLISNILTPYHGETYSEPIDDSAPLDLRTLKLAAQTKAVEDIGRQVLNGKPRVRKSLILNYPDNNENIRSIMRWLHIIILHLDFANVIEMKGFNATKELENFYLKNSNEIFAAIEFRGTLDPFPDDIQVALRFPYERDAFHKQKWKINLLPSWIPVPLLADFSRADGSHYKKEFLKLQYFITKAIYNHRRMPISESLWTTFRQTNGTKAGKEILETLTNPRNNFNVGLRAFSEYPPVKRYVYDVLEFISGFLLVLSFMYTEINIIRSITHEKEKQLKEVMKIMGLSNWLHWTAWFVKSLMFLMISCSIIIILFKYRWSGKIALFEYTNGTVLFLFFTLYSCSIVTFAFALSVFFSKANIAVMVGTFVWFAAYAPFVVILIDYSSMLLRKKLAACLAMNSAMSLGIKLMLKYESQYKGYQWGNLFKPIAEDKDNISPGHIMIMLILDTLLYLLIALYVEQVLPGEYGVPKPWYFLCQGKFWCRRRLEADLDMAEGKSALSLDMFEKEPRNLKIGIQIIRLNKVFDQNVVVKDLTLNMYENQVTVLLGHNGAGKTTTICMLAGIVPPTSGTAYVNNYDIRTEINEIRSSLGFCPQHNILFNNLTVCEHLYFCSRFKGVGEKEAEAEVGRFIELLQLKPKMHSLSRTLSGGMKRKLSVAMALCGKSKIVMLDEPTAGIDAPSRRALWKLIQNEKQGRTILLTTHYMDEADFLGDRIAIMVTGELQCSGSSFFLKKKYGAGYRIVMEKSEYCDPNEITQLLKKYIPEIEIKTNVGSELSYLLEERYSPIFQNLLDDVETKGRQLGIKHYGISLTTLEEVFMKVGKAHGQKNVLDFDTFKDISSSKTGIKQEELVRLKGSSLIYNQMLAIFIKKVLITWRSIILTALAFFFPILLLSLGLRLEQLIAKQRAERAFESSPSSTLKLTTYKNQHPIVLLEIRNETKQNKSRGEIFNYYNKTITSEAGTQLVENIEQFLQNELEKYPYKTRTKYLFGATIKENGMAHNITAWFNKNAYHAATLAYSSALNALLKQKLQDDKIGITFINHPLLHLFKDQRDETEHGDIEYNWTATTNEPEDYENGPRPHQRNVDLTGVLISTNMTFTLTTVTAYYLVFYVKERSSKFKHLQYVCGTKVLIFWTVSFLWDISTYFILIIGLILTFIAFPIDGYRNKDELGKIVFVLFYFGVCFLPQVYLASLLFVVPSRGYIVTCLFGIGTGLFGQIIRKFLEEISGNKDITHYSHWFLLLTPYYNLSSSLYNVYFIYITSKSCEWARKQEVEKELLCGHFPFCCGGFFQWDEPGVGSNTVYAFSTAIVYFALLCAKDCQIFGYIAYYIRKTHGRRKISPVFVDDSDVAEEKEKIRNTPEEDLKSMNVVVLKDVTKYYGNLLAVDKLCLTFKQYECFGLLGLNSAGKTTTFKILTGDIRMTSGEAWVNGYSLNTQLSKVRTFNGYCPQFDALYGDLTPRETIIIFALIRGIPFKESISVAETLAKDFDFEKYMNMVVKKLSGGNKRKVSAAISLVGDPPVVYMDEPTAGMDVISKRHLWNVICAMRDQGKCIVFTSHSMDECEALCTRLAIMVNGILKCLGSQQHLKNKFAEYYILIIKIKEEADSDGISKTDTAAVKGFVEQFFLQAKLTEEHQELLTYQILGTQIPCSEMFGILETAKNKFNIEDYSLSQSSLEQVFLYFTKQQKSDSIVFT